MKEKTKNSHQANSPTWGQIKKLAQMAKDNLKAQNKLKTTSNLMVAMLVTLTMVVSLNILEQLKTSLIGHMSHFLL